MSLKVNLLMCDLVAVTRAQALFVVIGDPYVLALDPLWREFINFVVRNGGYKGHPIDWDPEEPVDSMTDFAEQRRKQALSELDELIGRMDGVVCA